MKRLLLVFLAACGGAPTQSSAPTPLPAVAKDEGLAVVPMSFTDSTSHTTIELRADGTILARGQVVAKLTGSDIRDVKGTTLLGVGADGNITFATTDFGRFDADGSIRAKDSARLFVSDDGVIHFYDKTGKPQFAESPDTMHGFVPRARRTAEALVLASALFKVNSDGANR